VFSLFFVSLRNSSTVITKVVVTIIKKTRLSRGKINPNFFVIRVNYSSRRLCFEYRTNQQKIESNESNLIR
jgi:hypothetical protein